ncbi:rod shape-determining protein MreD [Clostridium sp. Cult1]|uniref:rod shape-determining protein MreD n=1 Tax=Clostridium sp. Cult1 TaxID=2079002 RepID=UPI001F01F674|nr:rod shape-determining protein MreD [Clostridium sp. Cult1]MCF6463691.1 rod shape-determining protein MreD [Clostridium sp. Cult1]
MFILITFLIIIINFILQSTILQYFNIFNVVPNTGLVIIVVIALLKGKRAGSIVGLIAGLLQDIIFSPVIGINGFLYFFIGYLVGMTENKLSKDNILIPFIMTLISTICYHLFYYLFMYFLSYNISFLIFFKDVVIIEMLYNSFISIILYKWFSKIFVIPSIRFGRR